MGFWKSLGRGIGSACKGTADVAAGIIGTGTGIGSGVAQLALLTAVIHSDDNAIASAVVDVVSTGTAAHNHAKNVVVQGATKCDAIPKGIATEEAREIIADQLNQRFTGRVTLAKRERELALAEKELKLAEKRAALQARTSAVDETVERVVTPAPAPQPA